MPQTRRSGTRRPRLGTHYWRLWWANAISSTGDGAFVAALPLLAVTISRDPRLVAGAVVAAVAVLVVSRIANIAVLGLAGLLLGSAEVVFGNAAQAMLPALVPPE